MTVCIDTAHLFAAGYDFRTPDTYKKTFKEFDDIVGLSRLKCFHMNDSKKELASRVDRHEHIGYGKIGPEGFRLLMNDKRFEKVNIVSSGVHARRSQYLFRRTLGDNYRVGIIAVPSSEYDPKRWWSSSAGFKGVILETLAYLYTRLILPFYDDPPS